MVRSIRHPLTLVVAVFVFLGTAGTGCSVRKDASPNEIVRAIEHEVGASNAPAGSTIDWMPYDPPVPAGAQPVLVGNTRVYLNAAPDTAIVVRPTINGVQTFMYLSGSKAPGHYAFKFKLLPHTKLEKAGNGSVSMVDLKSGRAVPVLKQPWALSAGVHRTYRTTFSVNHSTVTQIIDIRDAKFPLIADPDFEDPLTQIIEGRVPVIAEARHAAKDGPSHPLPGGYGRYYAGPNGLEIRLNSRGTIVAIHIAIDLSTAGGATVDALIAEAAAKLGPMVATAIAGNALSLLKEIGAPIINDKFDNEILRNQCLGVTLPKGSLGAFLNHYAALLSMQYFQAFKPLGPNDAKVWLESCNLGSSAGRHDSAQPPAPPITSKTDTQPATPAQPVPQPAPQTTPPAPQTTSPPPPVYHDVDMNNACQTQYHDPSLSAKYTNWNDPYSWVCVNSSGTVVATVISVQGWCDDNFPGSKAVTIDSTAYGWRCKK